LAQTLGRVALKQRRRGHDPGRVVRDLAVMLADGASGRADSAAATHGLVDYCREGNLRFSVATS
jgi:hypothetical protein